VLRRRRAEALRRIDLCGTGELPEVVVRISECIPTESDEKKLKLTGLSLAEISCKIIQLRVFFAINTETNQLYN